MGHWVLVLGKKGKLAVGINRCKKKNRGYKKIATLEKQRIKSRKWDNQFIPDFTVKKIKKMSKKLEESRRTKKTICRSF